MEALLDHLRRYARTLTIYNYDGQAERLERLERTLAERGVAVRTVTDPGGPHNACVFHRGTDPVGTAQLDQLLPAEDEDPIERAFAGESPALAEVPFDGESTVTVSPETDRGRMVGISREFERRALRRGGGTLRSGFQSLSILADSERTQSVYQRLSEMGVDVAVHGTPDAVPDVSFDVVADESGELSDYWFLLYDGGDDDGRKAALIARETEPAVYEAFWTVDPDVVDDLIHMASERYAVEV
ncbi:MAG: hypothetical protein ABEH56_07775 [Salinirussus sp.]